MAVKRAKQPGAFSAYEWLLATRYLRSRKHKRLVSVFAGFSVIGIMLGVATLITVMSVMNGFRAELFDKLGGARGHLAITPTERPFTDYAAMAEKIAKIPGIDRTVPIIRGQVLASANDANEGVLVQGMRSQDLQKMKIFEILQGSFKQFGVDENIAVSSGLAMKLGLYKGSSIKLTNPQGEETPFGISPMIKDYPIGVIFKIGMSELDERTVIIPLEDAQKYFGMEGRVQELEIFLTDPDAIDSIKQQVIKVAGEDVLVGDWRFANQSLFSALAVERNVMFLILTLIVLVAALNIISGLTMLVKDKSSDIAILRTMGATRASVLRIFIMSGAMVGCVGTIAGFLLGLALTLNVDRIRQLASTLTASNIFPEELYFFSKLPAKIDVAEVSAIVIVAFLLSLLSAVYPAYRAARLDPVQALRYG